MGIMKLLNKDHPVHLPNFIKLFYFAAVHMFGSAWFNLSTSSFQLCKQGYHPIVTSEILVSRYLKYHFLHNFWGTKFSIMSQVYHVTWLYAL